MARIAKAGAAGGLKGAAAAAVKEYAPELLKLALIFLIATVTIAILILTYIPSVFYGFDGSDDPQMTEMSEQAKTLGGIYYGLEQLQTAELSTAVTGISNRYTQSGEKIDVIEVEDLTDEDTVLWFVAITSVAAQQEPGQADAGTLRRQYAANLHYDAQLEGAVLRVTVSAEDPDEWMEKLGFDEESVAWACLLHDSLRQSNAFAEYANAYEPYIPPIGGDTQYNGAYWRGKGGSNEIDMTRFHDPTTKNNLDLAAFAEQAWTNNWGYVWGTFGGLLTRSLLDYKLSQYPDDVGGDRAYIEANYLNRRTADCIGLIKGYGWLDSSTGQIGYAVNGMPDLGADGMYEAAVESGATHGDMDHIPEIVGLCLWKPGHAGIYVGQGYVVEALNTRAGVVKTKLNERGWTAWYMNPYIHYETDDKG